MPVVISSALDTGIGISHGLALAASFPHLNYACGFATVALLESDICSPPALPIDGELLVERRVPNEELLGKYRADADRQEWWKNRISSIWAEHQGEEWL